MRNTLCHGVGGGLCLAMLASAAAVDTELPNAAMQGDKDSVLSLLKAKVNVNAAQGDGMTALHWAAFRDDVELAKRWFRPGQM